MTPTTYSCKIREVGIQKHISKFVKLYKTKIGKKINAAKNVNKKVTVPQ